MDDEMSEVPLRNQLAGVHHNFDEINNGGEKLHDNDILPKSVHSCMATKVNDLKDSPKLYFFEGLMEALSEKRNEDSVLPRSLIDRTHKESSMALVLWKPKPVTNLLTGSPLLNNMDNSTCSRLKDSSHRPKEDKENSQEEEKDEKEDMDITVS